MKDDGEAAEAIAEEMEALREESRHRGWFRLEYAVLTVLAVLFGIYAAMYFVLGVDLDALKNWGYLGIFFIAMAGSATIVLPTPSTVAIFGGGIVLDPVLGIPAPILVGLVAGLGDAIGEFSGYGLGFAGTDLLRQQRMYPTFERWMASHGTLTVFLLCTFPNPFFDIAGAAATAQCRGSATYTPKVGNREPKLESRQWTFQLRKMGEDWKIQSAQTRR